MQEGSCSANICSALPAAALVSKRPARHTLACQQTARMPASMRAPRCLQETASSAGTAHGSCSVCRSMHPTQPAEAWPAEPTKQQSKSAAHLMLRARAAACAARTTQSTHPHRTRRHALPELCRQAADSACMHQACSSSFRCCASSLCPRSCCIEANLRRTAYIKHLQQPALLLLLLLPQRSGSACMTHSLLPYPANATGHYS